MVRPKLDPEKRRTVRLETLLTKREADAMDLDRGKTPVSEYIRDALLRALRPFLRR